MPLFPDESTEVIPREPPNLEHCDLLAIDTETYDPQLETHGPGFIRKNGAFCAGVSMADGQESWYFPIAHSRGNCEWDVKSWLQDVLLENRRYVFCNAHYDVEALWSLDAVPGGRWSDISISQALIDEEFKPGYGLDAISTFWTGEGKDEGGLLNAAATFGCKTAKEAKKVIWLLHGGSVSQYAKVDAERTLASYVRQAKKVDELGLDTVLDLEENLLGLTWQMRLKGVRFDKERAQELWKQYSEHENALTQVLWKKHRVNINPWSEKDIKKYCYSKGISDYDKTPKGGLSFTGTWLEKQKEPVLKAVAEIRTLGKMRRDFIESWLDFEVDGFIHPRWMQTMTEAGGTRSGRMASANPNLQQVPVRDPDHGPLLRSLFLPAEGQQWGKFDYQAQEIRIAVHFAARSGCYGVESIVKQYNDNPAFDFHSHVAKMAGIARTPAKTLALGTLYGMAPKKTVRSLGMNEIDAQSAYNAYFEMAPYFKQLAEKAMDRAKSRGYVTTFLNRRRRFQEDQNIHKALNAVVQGTGADLTKAAMWKVYDELKHVPLVQAHDELGYSVKGLAQAMEIKEVMEHALAFVVPMLVEPSLAHTWNNNETTDIPKRINEL